MHHFRRPLRAAIGVFAGAALIIAPASAGFAVDAGQPAEPFAAAPFTENLQTDLMIGDSVRPSDFVASHDGLTGYVTSDESDQFVFVDLVTRTVSGSITLPPRAAGGVTGSEIITLSPDGTRAYIVLNNGYWSNRIAVIDLENRVIATVYQENGDDVQATRISADGTVLYSLGLSGDLRALDAATGDQLAHVTLTGSNYHSLEFAAQESELVVGGQVGLRVLNAADLTELRAYAVEKFSDVGNLAYDSDASRLYASDSSGSRLGVLNPATGEMLASASVGSPMHEVVGSDELNRAYGNVPYWDMVMSADFATGKRSESFRATPSAPFSLAHNPVTGDLLSANGGWSNAEKGSTVSIINAPEVTDPANATATRVGDEVTFSTVTSGIKAARGGLNWQSSTNGTDWTDIEGARGDQLTVTVTGDSIAASYRVRWVDDFWGASGASSPAIIEVPGPVITHEGPLAEGTVGAVYAEVQITATGQDDLRWSVGAARAVNGVPEGMSLAPETGLLSGTPTTAGDYVLTVSVTDVFGTDTKEFPLTVVAQATTPPTTPPTSDPTPQPDADHDTNSDAGADSDTLAVTGADPSIAALIALALLGAGGVVALTRVRTRRA